MRRFVFPLLLGFVLAACQQAAPPRLAAGQSPSVIPPGVTQTGNPAPTAAETARAEPTRPTAPTETQQPAGECLEDEASCILDGHFLFQRPIGVRNNRSIERTYRYGSTQAGRREPHHGVEFPNAQGTPVLAAADGTVIFAGDDRRVTLAWVPAYYGRVVVIEHHLPGEAQAVYSLYAHLFSFKVSAGQRVRAGEQIGEVGATGTAIGSHLHFEVRASRNDYRSNRNPELWLSPLPGSGVLAGRLEDAHGKPVRGLINVQRMENGVLNPLPVTALETYSTNESQAVSGDDVWHENFAAGELPAGEYRLSVVYLGTIHEQVIKIEAGRLTFVKFGLK